MIPGTEARGAARAPAPMGLPPAFRYRNYRLYFLGMSASLAGYWMQSIAMSWLIYRMTGSVLMLGVVAFASQIPMLVGSPFGGLLADRFDRRRLLMLTQALSLVQAIVLTVLTLSGQVQAWQLVALSLLLGSIYAVDTPARQAIVAQLIDDRADLSNAIAVNGLLYNTARMVGPAAGGMLVAAYGEGVCFLVNAATYVVMIAMLMRMRIAPERGRHAGGADGGLMGGVHYARRTPSIRVLLLLLGSLGLVALPHTVLLPYFAKHVHAGQADTLGLIMGSAAAGSVLAALYAMKFRKLRRTPGLIAGASISLGAALSAFAYAPSLPLAILAMLVVGSCTLLIGNGSSSLIHMIVPDHLRGRTMSLFTVAWFGVVPVGSFVVGALADHIGPQTTLLLCGLCTLIIGVQFRRAGLAPLEEVLK